MIQLVSGIFRATTFRPSPAASEATAEIYFRGRTGWKIADCRAVPGRTEDARIRTRSSWNFRCIVVAATTSNLAAVPEKRDALRGWRQGVPSEKAGDEKTAACRHNTRTNDNSVVGTRKEMKLMETFVLSHSRKQKAPARLWKAFSDYDKPSDDLSIYFLRTIKRLKFSAALQCVAYCTSFLRNIDRQRRDSRRR